MATRGEAAIAAARKQSRNGTTFPYGMCLQRVRLAYGVGPREPDASWAWRTARYKHTTSKTSGIPAGVPVFWLGGSSGHGHIAISTGGGMCLSTDIRRRGHWDEVPISEISVRWGLGFVGWTEDINGERVYTPAHATPLKRAIYHDKHYAKANSPIGDRVAADRNVWADRDLQRCLSGTFLNTHWSKPSAERFAKGGKVPRLPFRLLPWIVVRNLRAPGGYKIRTGGAAMQDAKRLGVPGIEFELKFVPSEIALRRLARKAKKVYGPDWAKRVEIKMLSQFDWKVALRRAKRAGFKTTVIRYSGDPSDLPKYVDHYRRP